MNVWPTSIQNLALLTPMFHQFSSSNRELSTDFERMPSCSTVYKSMTSTDVVYYHTKCQDVALSDNCASPESVIHMEITNTGVVSSGMMFAPSFINNSQLVIWGIYTGIATISLSLLVK